MVPTWQEKWHSGGSWEPPQNVLDFIQGADRREDLWTTLCPAYFCNEVTEAEDVAFVDAEVGKWLTLGKVREWDVAEEGPVVVAGVRVIKSGFAGKKRLVYNGAYASYVCGEGLAHPDDAVGGVYGEVWQHAEGKVNRPVFGGSGD